MNKNSKFLPKVKLAIHRFIAIAHKLNVVSIQKSMFMY